MSEAQAQVELDQDPHPYHLVEPSPWPIVASIAAFVLAVGAVIWMHGHGMWLMLVGAGLILWTMYVWWRDVIREGTIRKEHTETVTLGFRYGMALFIASEVMFFAAFFWAFFNAALFPPEAIGGIWPPEGIQTFDPFDLPFLNTLILLLSGVTITWSHHALIENDRLNALRGLALTILLGLCFMSLQIFEYTHAYFGFTDGIYASTFYMATGFHGFHVFVGTIFLTVCFFRMWKHHFTGENHFAFEAAAWYWHFVDVVWLFLFVAIYWWGA